MNIYMIMLTMINTKKNVFIHFFMKFQKLLPKLHSFFEKINLTFLEIKINTLFWVKTLLTTDAVQKCVIVNKIKHELLKPV